MIIENVSNLYSLDIQFSWDPTLLEYVSHTVKSPVEDYPNGILHAPVWRVIDEVKTTARTYRIAETSLALAEAFNSPNANATVFNMTFNVKKVGAYVLSLDAVELAVDIIRFPDVYLVKYHRVKNGQFQTPHALSTAIYSI